MEAMRNGDFTDEEIAQTKAVIQNQMLETLDTPRGLQEVLYHNVIANTAIQLEAWLTEMQKTSKEAIMAVAKKIDLDTIYFLTGTEAGD
jgi:predicted Zn-dependent peptidase